MIFRRKYHFCAPVPWYLLFHSICHGEIILIVAAVPSEAKKKRDLRLAALRVQREAGKTKTTEPTSQQKEAEQTKKSKQGSEEKKDKIIVH